MNVIDLYDLITIYHPYIFEGTSRDNLRNSKDSFSDLVLNKFFFIDSSFVRKSSTDSRILKMSESCSRITDKDSRILDCKRLRSPKIDELRSLLVENIEIVKSMASYSKPLIDEIRHSSSKMRILLENHLLEHDRITDIIFQPFFLFHNNEPKFRPKKIPRVLKSKSRGSINGCWMYFIHRLYLKYLPEWMTQTPPSFIVKTWYSGFVERDKRFKKEIGQLFQVKGILHITPYYLISTEELKVPDLVDSGRTVTIKV